MLSKLTFKESIELRIHLIGCGMCKLYVKQSNKINEMIRQLLKEKEIPTVKLDDRFKETLQERIEDQLNKN